MEWPQYRPYFPALVRLLQGVVYADEDKYWPVILNYRKEIEKYFLKIGLLLVVVEHEEFAYLHSVSRDDAPAEYGDMPKLTRRRQLSFQVTIICVLLKKHYIQHQENIGNLEPPLIQLDDLFLEYQSIPIVANNDEWRGRQHFDAQLNKVKSDLKLVKESGIDEKIYRILPSINSLVNAEFLDQLDLLNTLKLEQDSKEAEQEIDMD